ncbi:hypothetical protein PGH07_01140 [Sulfurovum sp. zt1-1]|uniref:Uncharacterized protein n=1 Tax=Sulfurovum zhangzhouensis TaxID=3019067 RepID=A0ABT7QVC0_9BACT|nr:hypothetical protein [Sulfurovum zhangzhouensis]MDM5270776.1 hypothetical protein [Sulfurovum zhangzhouensis]
MIKYISRKQLYIQVWSQPMTQVALKYSLPTYELKKVCDALLIPLPKVGHWSKIKHGKIVPIPELPPIFNKLFPYEYCPTPNKKIEKQNSSFTEKIQIKKTLQNPHPLIEKTKATLKNMSTDEYNMKCVVRNGINLRVSKANESRALRIIDSVFKWFEKNGATILYPYEHSTNTYIQIENEKIEIFIREKSKYIGMVEKKYGSYSHEVRGYEPTGILSIGIGPYCCYGSGLRKNFSDGKTKKVEDQINEFVKSVFAHAEYKKQETIKRKIREEEQEKIRKEQEHLKQRQELEQQMSDQLMKDANDFHQSQKLHSYIEEVIKRAEIQYPNKIYPQGLSNWIQWAKNQVYKLDPLNNRLPNFTT